MDSGKKYLSPFLEVRKLPTVNIITTSFEQDTDANQGEWDNNEGNGGLW